MKLICPTDFSPAAVEASDVAAALAAKRKLPVQLIYSAESPIVGGDIPAIALEDLVSPEQLEREALRLASWGADVSSIVLSGPAHLQIVRTAQEGTEMIVMGSTGKGGAERWLLGSVSERVAEGAPVPTLVVRSAQPLLAWLRGSRPLRVLCAVDFSTSADAALAVGRQLMDLGLVEFEAAYVSRAEGAEATVPPEDPPSERRLSVQRDVWERVQQMLGCAQVKIHYVEATDNPAFSFVRLADERRADLVVIGTHQRHGLSRLMSPSFSRRVLKHAAANVLCVPLVCYKPQCRLPKVDRVLVATDLSSGSESLIQHGCSLLPSGGSLRLLHVCQTPRAGIDPLIAAQVFFEHSMAGSRETAEAEEKMYSIAPRQLATGGVTMSVRAMQHEDVAAAVCEGAEEYGADVICIGSGSHSEIARAVLGSTVQKIVAKSHRPVLVVPPEVR